jgi:hypothetical protein
MFFFWRKEKSTKGKDLAKVLTGAATIEIVNHAILAASGMLPMHFFGISISNGTNIIILLAWIVVLKISIYKAWIKKD